MKKTCAIVLGGLAAMAQGQILNESFSIVPDGWDFRVGDGFGASVDLDAGLVVVGSPFVDGLGAASGAAYVFDAATGSQLQLLEASDSSANDHFGHQVAIDGGIVAVGAFGEGSGGGGLGYATGAVYLFDASTGVELHKLTASDGAVEDFFGVSVAMDGGLVAVGSYWDDDNGNRSGSAYVFDAVTGAQLHKLLPTDGAAEDRFGVSIAIDGGLVAVGASADDDGGDGSGSVYIFDASTGAQLMKLTASDATSLAGFGGAVAMDGGILAVGAPGDGDGSDRYGAAYVFDASSGVQLRKLTLEDGEDSDRFGRPMSMDGGLIAVGAPGSQRNGQDSGGAFVFDAATGEQLHEIALASLGDFVFLGNSVAIKNGVIVAGGDIANEWSNPVYLFDSNAASCPGDIADDFGALGGDGMVSFGDFLALLGLVGPCSGGLPVCTGDIADDFGTLGGDGMVSFGDFLALLGLVGACP